MPPPAFFFFQYSCESNCGKYLNPYKRLILTTTCPNCDDIQAISYNWSAEHVHASVPFKLWPDRALTLQNGHSAVIRGKTFNSSSSYRIRVVASRLASGLKRFDYFVLFFNYRLDSYVICPREHVTRASDETSFDFSV